jgi:hypothetical protein
MTEYSLAFEFAQSLIDSDSELKDKYPKIPHLLNLVKEKISEQDVYVTSFSNDGGNRLSQWRGYGSAGGGCSIGISSLSLLKHCQTASHKGRNTLLASCKYGEDSHPSIQKIFSQLKYLLDQPAPAPTPAEGFALLRQLLVQFVGAIALIAAISKHQGFKEEQEWRLIEMNPDPETESLMGFHPRHSSVVPHLRVPLAQEGAQIELESVRVAPTPHPEESMKAVRMLLKKYDVACKTVEKSDIPYRYW